MKTFKHNGVTFKKINITKARKIAKEAIFDGFFVGNKVAPFHFFKGWCCAVKIVALCEAEFNRHYNSFNFYLEPELGNRIAIYVKL